VLHYQKMRQVWFSFINSSQFKGRQLCSETSTINSDLNNLWCDDFTEHGQNQVWSVTVQLTNFKTTCSGSRGHLKYQVLLTSRRLKKKKKTTTENKNPVFHFLRRKFRHSFWWLLYAHRHRSVLGAAGHNILTPANQLMVWPPSRSEVVVLTSGIL
jgi:hypothetical protein